MVYLLIVGQNSPTLSTGTLVRCHCNLCYFQISHVHKYVCVINLYELVQDTTSIIYTFFIAVLRIGLWLILVLYFIVTLANGVYYCGSCLWNLPLYTKSTLTIHYVIFLCVSQLQTIVHANLVTTQLLSRIQLIGFGQKISVISETFFYRCQSITGMQLGLKSNLDC